MTVTNQAVGDELLAFLKKNLDQRAFSSNDEQLMTKYVGVKDITRFYNALGSEQGYTAEELWDQLKTKLESRQAKDLGEVEEEKERHERSPAPDATIPQEEPEPEEMRAEEEEEDPEEVARREAKAARKLARKLEKERLERAEAEAEEKAARKAAKKANKYTDENPLLAGGQQIDNRTEESQEEEEENLFTRKRPPVASEELMNRTYTPKCPNCATRFSRAPPQWNCSLCLRRYKKEIKCWQPDEAVKNCATCSKSVGRFTRHHCRNCGRVVCGKCTEKKALIPSIGFDSSPVKVCVQCMDELVPQSQSPVHEQTEEPVKA